MIRQGVVALASHWVRHPLQLAMLVVGLALATALWSGVQAINAEARAAYAEAAAALGGDRLARIVAAGGGGISQADYVALRRAGWQVSPVVEGTIRIGGRPLRLLGLDPATLPPEARIGAGPMAEGAAADRGALLASPETVAEHGGDLVAQEGVPPGVVLADIGVALQKLGTADITRLIVAAQQPLGLPPLDQVVSGLVLQPPDASGDLARLTDSFHLNLTAFGLLAFLVGMFIVQSAIGLAFDQRRGVVRTLRALGMPLATVMALLVAELVGMALLAGLAGLVLGYGVAAALLPDVAATLAGLYGASVDGTLHLRPVWWLQGLGIAIGGTMAAAALHLFHLSRMTVLAPVQPEAWARGSRRLLLVQGLAAAGFWAVALLLALTAQGLTAGFGILAALVLGAAAGLPVLLAGLLALAQALVRRVGAGPVADWFWADARAALPGLSLALVALMLALATNIGVGTMVASFRATFTGWLDQRLASELYVTARSEAEAAAITAWLGPRVDAVLPIWQAEAVLMAAPATVYGIVDHETYRQNWPMLQGLPGVWDRVTAGQAVLINEQLHYRQGLDLGDTLALPGGWIAPVAGIYSDYGNPQAQVIVGLDRLVAHFPDAERLRMGVRVAPDRVAALEQAIAGQFGLPLAAMQDQASVKRLSLQVFDRTFSVTAALNLLTLAVAGLAMFASLLTLAGLRLPQVAPLWALGMTRARLAWLDLGRCLMLAMLAMLAAVPVGLGLAWVLLAVVNVAAFGWRLPMQVFPADWLRLGLSGMLAAAVAAAIPAIRLARTSPSALLRVFADER